MHPDFYRTDIEEHEFQAHARINYSVGEPIDPTGIKHPVWVLEAARMNYEAWRRNVVVQQRRAAHE